MKSTLSIRNISKSFSGVKALDSVSIDFFPGEVHAIMGENGAGKSTLMKVLFGIYKRDQGEITYLGEPVEYTHASEAIKQGIAMVQQELTSILDLSVAENIFLNREPKRTVTGFINKKKMNNDVMALFHDMGIDDINPHSLMRDLDIAQMQLVDIAKAISYRSNVLILDEATSSLTTKEVKRLFELLGKLKKNGTAILYITHRMNEVFEISDRVTILRDGRVVDTCTTSEVDESALITKMVGREIKDVYPKSHYAPGEVALELRNFSRDGEEDNNNLLVRRGEVIGMAGLVGAGRTEMMESFFGLRKDYRGEAFINGKPVTIKKPSDAIANGIALITEDRKMTGLNLLGDVSSNMSAAALKGMCKAGWVQKKKEQKIVNEKIEALRIKTPSSAQIISYLSGGNQQKVVIAKWLLTNADIIIMDEPTRGVDVGAKYEIYQLINELKSHGKAIILISSEMPELIGMCDKLAVMYKGKIKALLEKDEMSQENIMAKAIG